MAVLINFKICDNAKECGGIGVCPTGALSWDEENETIKIDNEKCISCGQCENECPIGAIRVAKDDAEYKRIEKEIDDDPRTVKDLFVDRYGATPLSEFFMISEEELTDKISNSVLLVECYNDDSIQCLLKSIPIKKITDQLPNDTLFYKMKVSEKSMEQYDIKELPTLLVYNKGEFKGKIEGYYSIEHEDEIIANLNELLN